MEFIKAIIGKEPEKITYEDIEKYFAIDRKESDKVEFKSYNPNGKIDDTLKGINEAVCSFLNSDGGLIIWGSPRGEKAKGQKEKLFKGALTPLNDSIEPDYLVNKISDAITPLPNSIRFHPIDNQNKRIYLIEIDKSQYSPHQTNNTYYMRIDGQKRPAPHHFIEALFKKIQYPNLKGIISIRGSGEGINRHEKIWISYTISITNISPYLNEEDVFFILHTKNGMIDEDKLPFNIELDGLRKQATYRSNLNSLHYGLQNTTEIFIKYADHSLDKYEYKDEIALYFGGKKSPLKLSFYWIDLYNYDSQAELIDKKHENNLLFNVHEDIKKTKSNYNDSIYPKPYL